MSWAKLPSKWVRPVERELDLDACEDDGAVYALRQFQWRKDGSSSTAAFMILIALAIQLNQSLRGLKFDDDSLRPTSVAVTYDELQRMTGFARASVKSGLQLLEYVGAIRIVKVGRANHYALEGVGAAGDWCQLPQAKLLRPDGTLTIKTMERKRKTLYALKLYVLFLALRSQKYNTTSISYAGITKWTGIGRSDIGPTVAILIAWDLVSVSEDLDERHLKEKDRSNRYRILGLSSISHQRG